MQGQENPLRSLRNDLLSQEGSNPYFPYDPIRGYIDIYDKDNSMWYWLVRARENPDTAPIVIWLEGGPGEGGSIEMVCKTGPFYVMKNFSETHPRAYLKGNTTWAQKANMVYPDFPLGCGFSTVTDRGLSFSRKQVQQQILIFFEKFLERHPEFKGRPLYVTGVSYGGHWVPYAATALKYAGNPDINVVGFYIGSGFMDIEIANESYLGWALKNYKYTGFTESMAPIFRKWQNLCAHLVEFGANRLYQAESYEVCFNQYYNKIVAEIQKKKPKFDGNNMPGNLTADPRPQEFLNNTQVIKFLDVRKPHFLFFNQSYFNFFIPRDLHVSMEPYLRRLLDDGVKGVFTSGTLDFITNYVQSEKTVAAVEWKGQEVYNKKKMVPFHGGVYKEYMNLREYRVDGSGHGICTYKPEIAAEIFNSLIAWEPSP